MNKSLSKGKITSLSYGTDPVMIIAPHAYKDDDENTEKVADVCANRLNCYAIINQKWKKGATVDPTTYQADFNKISHLKNPAVKGEFWDSVESQAKMLSKNNKNFYVFLIHGMKDILNPTVDVVLGYGEGSPSRYTCDPAFANKFAYLSQSAGWATALGGVGGKFSAWSNENLAQAFKSEMKINNAQVIQIELANKIRGVGKTSTRTSHRLSDILMDVVYSNIKAPANYSPTIV